MLVDERHDVVGKLQTHLDKSKLSYQEAVCAIRDLDTDEPIPEQFRRFHSGCDKYRYKYSDYCCQADYRTYSGC